MLSIMPSIMHIASSLSSVICPEYRRHGPPPGIFMQSSMNFSPWIPSVNSFLDPQASPTNAPTMQPKALSSKVFSLMLCKNFAFFLSWASAFSPWRSRTSWDSFFGRKSKSVSYTSSLMVIFGALIDFLP